MARPRIVAVDRVFDAGTQGILDITSKCHSKPAHDRDGRLVGTISAGEHAVNVRCAKAWVMAVQAIRVASPCPQ